MTGSTHLCLRIANDKCVDYSRVATITLSSCSVQCLFEGGIYSKCISLLAEFSVEINVTNLQIHPSGVLWPMNGNGVSTLKEQLIASEYDDVSCFIP